MLRSDLDVAAPPRARRVHVLNLRVRKEHLAASHRKVELSAPQPLPLYEECFHCTSIVQRSVRLSGGRRAGPHGRGSTVTSCAAVRLCRASVDGSKPAICGHRKTGHFGRPETAVEFYFMTSCVRKVVWTLVRQLRGPHLSTCA